MGTDKEMEMTAASPQPRVLDVSFKCENGTHTPTVLVGFAPDDYDARDAFARQLRAALSAAPVQQPAADERKAFEADLQHRAETWHDVCTLGGPDCDHRQLEIIAYKAGFRAALQSPAAPDAAPTACFRCKGSGWLERRSATPKGDPTHEAYHCPDCGGSGRAPDAAPVGEPAAWMDPETRDVINAERKRDWETVFGLGGKAKAKSYTLPLYATAGANADNEPVAEVSSWWNDDKGFDLRFFGKRPVPGTKLFATPAADEMRAVPTSPNPVPMVKARKW